MNFSTKKIFIDGGVLIDTPFFWYKDARPAQIPQGEYEQIECNSIKEGIPCLKIDEDNTPSIFNIYYTASFFNSGYFEAPFFLKNYEDCYTEFQVRISEILQLLQIKNLSADIEQILLRQIYMSIVTTVDTFICDTILTKIVNDKETFYKYFQKYILDKIPDIEIRQKKLDELLSMWDDNKTGDAEQKVFYNVLGRSYTNLKTIKILYKYLFNIRITDKDNKMKNHFHNRHLIAHRNGRKKGGDFYKCTIKDITCLVVDTNAFIKSIFEKIMEREENHLPKPPEDLY